MKIIPSAAIVLIFYGQVLAQVPLGDTLATQHLDDVVITGQFEPQSAQKSVYRVRTIAMEKIQQRAAVTLQDVLNTELNIRFSQDQALGGSNLSMQGLTGQNVKVLIDGVPMVGRQGLSNEININQININSIERIEIVEGPMSVVYGADALAGVINIITKKATEGKLDVSAKVQVESIGSEWGVRSGIHNESVGVGYSWGKSRARVDATHNYFGGWQGAAIDRDKQWHPKTQYLINGTWGHDTEKTAVFYRADFLREDIYDPGLYEGSEATDRNYITNRLMHQLQGTIKLGNRWENTSVLAYTDYDRKTLTSVVNASTGDKRLSLAPGSQDITRFDGLTVRSSFVFKYSNKISFQSGVDVNMEWGSGQRIKTGTQAMTDAAVFLSGEWIVNSRLQMRPGIRMIHNSVYQSPPIVPSLNAKVKVSATHDLRFSYGRGFRAPSLRELYFDFFDASHSIRGNENLKAELSHSFNGSWNWLLQNKDRQKQTLTMAGFYNQVENKIDFAQNPSNFLETTYLNVNRFSSVGFTLSNQIKWHQLDFTFGGGYTGRSNQFTEANRDSLLWSPEITSSLSYRFSSLGLTTSLFYKHTGRDFRATVDPQTQVAGIATIEDFHWMDLTVQKSLGMAWVFTGGVRNIFNASTLAGGGTNSGHAGGSAVVGYGRSYFVSISYSLIKK
jgi:outer membrane receptor for ferrienterochelin and colicins